jgi:hypothetical protein
VLAMANSLEELAEECQGEALQLEQDVKIAKRISKQANLN